MDLRGFSGDRQGCRIELQYLKENAPDKPVVFLLDDTPDALLIREIIGIPHADAQSGLPRSWYMIKDVGNAEQSAKRALAQVTTQLQGAI